MKIQFQNSFRIFFFILKNHYTTLFCRRKEIASGNKFIFITSCYGPNWKLNRYVKYCFVGCFFKLNYYFLETVLHHHCTQFTIAIIFIAIADTIEKLWTIQLQCWYFFHSMIWDQHVSLAWIWQFSATVWWVRSVRVEL